MFENVPSPSVSPNPVPPTPPQPWGQPGGVPAAPQQPAPVAPPPQPVQDGKDWGPLKPIRTVPKPGEERIQSTLADAAMPQVADVETKTKLGLILGLIGLVVIIGGGTAAFVFFGKKTDDTKLNGNANSVAVVTNGNTNKALFPEGNSNVNQAGNQNVNAAANVNSAGNVNAAGNVNQATNSNGNTNKVDMNTNTKVNKEDPDNDAIPSYLEVAIGTNSNSADSDGDGFNDNSELAGGYSPIGSGRTTSQDVVLFCQRFLKNPDPLFQAQNFSAEEQTSICSKIQQSLTGVFPAFVEKDQTQVVTQLKSAFTGMRSWCQETFADKETISGQVTTCTFAVRTMFTAFFQVTESTISE